MAAHGVQGRGVLIDLRAHFGDERKLVRYDDLMAVMAADGVVVEPGDIVCLHTGFAERILEMGREPDPEVLHGACAVLDGRTRAARLDLVERPRGPRRRQLRGRGVSRLGRRRLLFDPAAARALPVQERHPARRTLALTPLANWLREHGRSHFL